MADRTDLVTMGKNIAKYRKEKKLTQRVLGELIDVSDKSISKWERGNIAPDITVLVPLADVLGVSVSEILGGTNDDLATVEGIKIYTKLAKSKVTKIFIMIISIISIVFSTIFLVNNHYKWNVYSVSTNDSNYFASGYLIKNQENVKILIDKLTYLKNDIGTLDEPYINKIGIEIKSKEKILFSKDIAYNEFIPIHNAFQDLSFFYEFMLNEIEDLNSLTLNIIYLDNLEKEIYYSIPLKY